MTAGRHTAIAFILLVIIGAIYIYPDIRFILESGEQYKGIGFTGTSEELLYLLRFNGIYKGSNDLSDIYCFEHQNDPWFRPFIGEFIVGNIGRMANISVVTLDIMMSFILNIILSILIFIFSYHLTASVRAGIVCSFAVIFGYNIISASFFTILKELFITLSYSKPLWFLRPISPQFYYIPFFISLIYAYRATNQFASKRDMVISGASLGLLFYINLFYWTFIYAGLGVLTVIYYWIKRKDGLRRIASVYVIATIISIPYWISVLKVINHPHYKFIQQRYEIISSRQPFFYAPYIIPAIVISMLLFFLKHRSRYFIVSFLTGGIICLNQQVITGRTILQQWSFYSNKTFLIISIVVTSHLMLNYILKYKNSYKTGLTYMIALFFTAAAFFQQNNYYTANKGYFLKNQRLYNVYGWLKKNTDKTDVVLTDPFQNFSGQLPGYRFLLTYTDNFSYITEPACMLISEEEVMYRILSSLLFLGYGQYDLEDYIHKIKQFMKGADPNIKIRPPSEDYYERIKSMYNALAERDPIEAVKRYKIDYILVDNDERYKGLKDRYGNNLKMVYRDSSYMLFRLI